jgi:hypothetical protein
VSNKLPLPRRHHRLTTVSVLSGVFLTRLAMDLLVIEAVVAAATVAHWVAVEVARNPLKSSRNDSKFQNRKTSNFCFDCCC